MANAGFDIVALLEMKATLHQRKFNSAISVVAADDTAADSRFKTVEMPTDVSGSDVVDSFAQDKCINMITALENSVCANSLNGHCITGSDL